MTTQSPPPHSALLSLERQQTLQSVLDRRGEISIQECGQKLVRLPPGLFSFETPHPYFSLGAPYGDADPFCLREEVVTRLCAAARALAACRPGFKLHIFDGYRPVSVQHFMIEHERARLARSCNWDPSRLSPSQQAEVLTKVYSVWAKPSEDPRLPTPHSTGAAIDLTIVDQHGQALDMGSIFDEACPEMLPNAFLEMALHDARARQIHQNRELLRNVLEEEGFLRITHEWWHFSYGDQMWAYLSLIRQPELTNCAAVYGEVR